MRQPNTPSSEPFGNAPFDKAQGKQGKQAGEPFGNAPFDKAQGKQGKRAGERMERAASDWSTRPGRSGRRCWRGRRGSALLMAVGLLVIFVMLGTMFLMVARLDAKQAKALAQKAPADPLADGIVQQVRSMLKADLHIDANDVNGPYDDSPSNAAGWRQFIDYPSGTAGSDAGDPWLASNERTTNVSPVYWAHLSNPQGMFDDAQVTNVRLTWNDPTWEVKHNPGAGWVQSQYDDGTDMAAADTDGDGLADAVLYKTDVRNVIGDEYYAAVRVVDLGGMINVNTAADPAGATTMPPATSPVSISPISPSLPIMSAADYTAIHNARCGGSGTTDLAGFYDKSARRLMDPANPYMPFAIGDELFLRWAAPVQGAASADLPASAVGRLYQAIPDISDIARSSMLTTFNCSRELTRRPADGDKLRLPITATTALDDPIVRQDLYEKLVKAMDASTSNQRKLAAHFVANLWAYISTDESRTHAFAWTPTVPGSGSDESFTVYGLVEQPVISEAYAYSLAETVAGSGDSGYCYAIELFNPTDKDIDLRYDVPTDTGYKLKIDATTANDFQFPNITLPGHKRLVIYSFNGYVGDGGLARHVIANAPVEFNLQGSPPLAPRVWNNLNFSEDKTVELVRMVRISGLPTEIPIDSVKGADFGYTINDKTTNDDPTGATIEVIKDGRRDDNVDRNRVVIGGDEGMLDYTPSPRTDNKLGQANGLGSTDLPNVWEGFPLVRPQAVPVDIADLTAVYAVGPEKNGDDFPHAIANFKDDISRGRPNFRGLIIAGATDYPDVPWATITGEFLDLLQPDETRMDEQADGEQPSRIYGRLNINTATAQTLAALPWPSSVTIAGTTYTVNLAQMLEYVLAYRDKQPVSGGPDYSNRAVASNIANLRAGSDYAGFLTPGEIAIPLADYVNNELLVPGWNGDAATTPLAAKRSDYLAGRDSLYKAVSNLITVNSDVFAASILIQLRDESGQQVKQNWYYTAVIDRSNCRKTGQMPAVLLFSQVN